MNREKIETQLAKVCVDATVKGASAVKAISARKATRIMFSAAVAMMTVGILAVSAYADDGGVTDKVNDMLAEVMKWVRNIGIIVAVFGAVNFGLGIANSDDAGRNRGLMTVAGGAVVGIAGQIAVSIS